MHQTPGSSGMSPAEVAYSSSARRARTLKRVRLWLSSARVSVLRASMNSTWLMTPSSRLRLAIRNAARAASARAAAVVSESRAVIEAIECLLHFEADLLRDFFLAQHDLAFGWRVPGARVPGRRRHRRAAR